MTLEAHDYRKRVPDDMKPLMIQWLDAVTDGRPVLRLEVPREGLCSLDVLSNGEVYVFDDRCPLCGAGDMSIIFVRIYTTSQVPEPLLHAILEKPRG